MRNINIIILLLFAGNAFSQPALDSLLAEVERNNTTLSAIRKSIDADIVGNKTGLNPSNPEVEFHYLWGNPSTIGNRTDFAVNQTFDFPTAYMHRRSISGLKNEQAELEYQKQRLDILHQVRMLSVDLTFHNARLKEYNKRVYHARQIAETYGKKLDAGETSALAFNKAQVNLLNLTKEQESAEIERDALLAELVRLNGGIEIAYTDSVFDLPDLLPGFEQWYAETEQRIPLLQWLKQELSISQKQKQLQVANSLPKFSAGYMSETVVGQQFQGVRFGVSIPLWENRNSVEYAKVKALAAEESHADAKLQFYNKLEQQYNKTTALQKSVKNYQEMLLKYNNRELASIALDKGEISLSEYYLELRLYYDSVDKLLEMKRSMNESYYELLKY